MDDLSGFGWSPGGGRGRDADERAAEPGVEARAATDAATQAGREWRRLASSLRRAVERLNAGDADGCRLLLVTAVDAAEEHAALEDAEDDERELSEAEGRRLRDGMEP